MSQNNAAAVWGAVNTLISQAMTLIQLLVGLGLMVIIAITIAAQLDLVSWRGAMDPAKLAWLSVAYALLTGKFRIG